MFKYFLILLLIFYSIKLDAQLFHQPITNFTPKEYGLSNSLYTETIEEDAQGLIYIGTAYGILQFDGVNWRKINIPSIRITSLASFQNRIFVGGQAEFGYLETNNKGKYEYKSLISELSSQEKKFTVIWKTLVWKDKIVFQSDEYIFIFEKGKLHVLKPSDSFHLAFVCEDRLFVRERNLGLMEFDGTKFRLVRGGEIFRDFGLFSILPFDKTTKLIVTQEKGFWKWDEKGIRPLKISVSLEKKLLQSAVTNAKRLSDGNIVLQTSKDGIFILDSNLQLICQYSQISGLRSSEVRGIHQDCYGNIWMATQKGVSRLQYKSPISTFGENSGLRGNILSVSVFEDDYLVGTTEGLFTNLQSTTTIFAPVINVNFPVWGLQKVPKGVWIGTDRGLFFYDGKYFKNIKNIQVTALKYVPELKIIIAAGKDGVSIFDSQNQRMITQIKEAASDAYGLAYELKNGYELTIWIGSKTMGVCEIQSDYFQLNFKKHVEKQQFNYVFTAFYGPEDGLPSEWICAFQSGKEVVFGTPQGLLKFISPSEILSLANDTVLKNQQIRGYFDLLEIPKNNIGKSITAYCKEGNHTWLNFDFQIGELKANESFPDFSNFVSIQNGRVNFIDLLDNQLFIASDDALAIYQNPSQKITFPKAESIIRYLIIGKDTVWYGDSKFKSEKFTIHYKENFLKINLASLYSDNGFSAQYAWYFDAKDSNKLYWSNNSQPEFSNLKEGEYQLHLLTRNLQGEIGNEVLLNFKILPPWYRSLWAIIVYLIILILIVYSIILLNVRRLKEKNKKLEAIIKIRTQEIVEQKEEIEIQKNRIEEILLELRSSISYAQRIQQALLPSEHFIQTHLPKHFILFKPRDVVSGDFYWASHLNKKTVIAAADCTGHGVPGAFMSMLGMSLLNEIVNGKEITEPSTILNILRTGIISALQQKGELDDQKDGLDISLLVIDHEMKKIHWAGANNSLWIIRKLNESELIEIKADKMPVAIHDRMDSFSSHLFEYSDGDRFFIFSDGFVDQFGGENGKKFMSKNLKNFFIKNQQQALPQIKSLLLETFLNWKGQESQVDDITVIGIEL